MLLRANTAEPQIEGGAHLQAHASQRLGDNGQDLVQVCLNGSGAQTVGSVDLHVGVGHTLFTQSLHSLGAQLTAQIRTSDIGVLVLTHGLNGEETCFFQNLGVNVSKNSVTGLGMVCTEGQHSLGLQTGAGTAHADTGSGALHHPQESFGVLGVIDQRNSLALRGGDVFPFFGRSGDSRGGRTGQTDTAGGFQLLHDFGYDGSDQFRIHLVHLYGLLTS